MASDLQDQLQMALGSTYTLERELGGGGMSRIFVARELALGRLVVMKVLPPELAAEVNVGRFRREIQLVAQLQHPHIVPVLSACDIGSVPYFTMPFVEGESLRARLVRSGALSIPDVVGTLHDVAKALAYAHRHGVVHRDIKPENILLADGTALVTDFGVAKALSASAGAGFPSTFASTSRGVVIGTPAYMAPEQVASDPTIDHRADLYALGVVAYELLTGRTPFADRAPRQIFAAHVAERPEPVDTFRPATPAVLAALVMRCLEKHPADRPQSAEEVLRELDAVGAPPGAPLSSSAPGASSAASRSRPTAKRRTSRMYVSAFALVAALTLGVVFMHGRDPWSADSLLATGAMKEREPVIVDDFASPPTDTLLGGVVSEAIRTDLGQSRVVTVVQPGAVRQVLARMRRADATRLDLALASEVAQRSGARVVVDGDVAAAGQGYVLTARLILADSGTTLAAVRETAADSREIIAAIDRLSRQLRARVGESIRSVRASPPLAQVTTSSLDALRKYAQGLHAIDAEGNYPKGEALLVEAVQLDSAFAMAYRKLGTVIGNAGGSATRRNDAFRQAYAHRDRLSNVERSLTDAAYYSYVEYDGPKAIAAYQAVLDAQPDNAIALNNIGILYEDAREYATSAQYFRRSIQVRPEQSQSYENLVDVQTGVGDTAGARQTMAAMMARFPGNPQVALVRATVALHAGQYDSAAAFARQADRLRPGDAVIHDQVLGGLGLIALLHGQLRAGERYFHERATLARQRGLSSEALKNDLAVAWDDVWFRHAPARGLARADALLASSTFDSLPPLERPYLEFAGLYAEGGQPQRARALLAEMQTQVPARLRMDPYTESQWHDVLGRIALAEGKPDQAMVEFRASDKGACGDCALPQLARAYDLAGNADSALAIYGRYVNTPGMGHKELDPMFIAGAYKRVGELEEARGDRTHAAVAYAKLLQLWSNADPELQPVVAEVRRRLAALEKDRAG
ncbi:MAG TPA: protein kinase [Gemmatimonadaceae bacterium]